MVSLTPVIFSYIMCRFCLKLRLCLVDDNDHVQNRGPCQGASKMPGDVFGSLVRLCGPQGRWRGPCFYCLLAETPNKSPCRCDRTDDQNSGVALHDFIKSTDSVVISFKLMMACVRILYLR